MRTIYDLYHGNPDLLIKARRVYNTPNSLYATCIKIGQTDFDTLFAAARIDRMYNYIKDHLFNGVSLDGFYQELTYAKRDMSVESITVGLQGLTGTLQELFVHNELYEASELLSHFSMGLGASIGEKAADQVN